MTSHDFVVRKLSSMSATIRVNLLHGTVRVSIPAGTLKAGDNTVRITTLDGSWVLYDWIGMRGPAGAASVGRRTGSA